MRFDPNREGWQFLSWTPVKTNESCPSEVTRHLNWHKVTHVTIARMVDANGEKLRQEETVQVPYDEWCYWARDTGDRASMDAMAEWIAVYLPRTDEGWDLRRSMGSSKTYDPYR